VSPPGQPSIASPKAIEEIVVTANKRREKVRDVADSVTAISGKDLARRQEVSLQDLASEVPGLSLEADDKTAVRIILRGLNTGGAGATVASVIDDVPTNATSAQTNASINTPNYDTYDLQRIEVLRGPQSTLYGATAEGGLIKYVTNPPDPTAYSGSLEGGLVGATDGGIGGTMKGFANFPLLDGKAAFRISAWNEWTPGYIDNPELGKTDSNSAQQYGWRASLLVNPTPDFSIRLTAERQTLLSNNADYVQVVGAAANPAMPPPNQLSPLNGYTNNTGLGQPSQAESALYYANLNYDFGFASLTSITSFAYNNFTNIFDYTNLNLAPGVTYGAYLDEAVYGQPLLLSEKNDSDGNKFNQELRLTSDPGFSILGQRLDWLGGFYYTRETTSFDQTIQAHSAADSNVLLAPAAGSEGVQSALSEWALFGQVDYFLLPTVDVALGGRVSGDAQHAQTSTFCCVLYGAAAVEPEISANSHVQLYNVAPRWHITEDTMIYARIATGYRPGGPNLPPPGYPNLASYGPDHTVNYEIGLRQDFLNRRVTADVTGYYINWKDVQILSIVDTATGPYALNGNAGDAVSKGVEWNLNWLPLDGLKLNAVGDYTDTRLTTDAPGLGGSKGDFLPYVPNISSSVNVDYSWASFADFTAFVSGTWSYVGQRYTGFSPSTSVSNSHTLLPSYNTGALRVGVQNRRYSLEAFINNISDAKGITYYANNGGANQSGLANFILPRIIGFTAKVSF
jgi:outer membrane receptor protein involved in Fe transport